MKITDIERASYERVIALAMREPKAVESHGIKVADIADDALRSVFIEALSGSDTVSMHKRLAGKVPFETLERLGRVQASKEMLSEYVRVISDGSVNRRLMGIAESIEKNVGVVPPLELAELSRQALTSVASSGGGGGGKASDIVTERMRAVEALLERKWAGESVMTGVPTGVAALDAFLGGYPRGVITAVGALPGMGKSSLGKSCAIASAGGKFGMHLFSLEDARDPYSDRILSELAGIPSNKIRSLDVTRPELERLKKASEWVSKNGTWLIDDRRGLTPAEMCREVRKHHRENNTSVVLLDYVQQVRSSDPKADERQCIDECIVQFANLARELNIAVVLFSQLNRSFLQSSKGEEQDMEARKPKLHHLKFSGKIGEEAKCVLLLHRDAYHDQNLRDDTMEVIVAKNNQGNCGSIIASWDGPRTKVY